MNLIGAGQAVDVIVVTPEDIERYRDAIGLVIKPALREGKVIYAARVPRPCSKVNPICSGPGILGFLSLSPVSSTRRRWLWQRRLFAGLRG